MKKMVVEAQANNIVEEILAGAESQCEQLAGDPQMLKEPGKIICIYYSCLFDLNFKTYMTQIVDSNSLIKFGNEIYIFLVLI